MKQRLVAGTILSLALAGGLAAQAVAPFNLPITRFVAMGGAHAALADDWSLLFANPAGLADAKPRFIAAQIGAKATGPLFDIGTAFLGSGSMLTNFTTVLANNDYKLYAAADLAGPLSFGYVGKSIGFGLFNRTHAVVDAAGISNINIKAEEEVLLVGGYAFGIDLGKYNRIEAGILAKGFARGGISKNADALALMNIVSNYMQQPFTLTTGIGIDLGLRWAWTAGLSAGLVCRDLYSPVLLSSYSSVQGFIDNPQAAHGADTTGTIPRDLDFGLAWSMPPGGLWGLVDSLVIALDYSRILDLLEPYARNPILNIGLGVETRILDIVSLRAGITEGYPNAGASLDLAVMKLDLSVWGSELGQEPGARSAFNLMSTLEFSY